MSLTVHTECACCDRPIDLEIDSEMRSQVLSAGASPLVTVPTVKARQLEAPNIIDDF